MPNLITEPQERCPVCGRKFESLPYFEFWFCWQNDHKFEGPNPDSYGRGIDKAVKKLRARILKEANND